jgi:crotonobetainyl-CoA:carnitine CoA-transferase CaiB-like acyl-CoA transferase
MLDFQAARWLVSQEVPKQAGNDHPTGIPTGVFKTKDGLMNLAATGKAIFTRFCEAADALHILNNPDYATGPKRSANRVALNAEIGEVLKTRTTAEWIKLLNDAGVPSGPINTIDEVFADEQVQHLGIAKPVKHPVVGDIRIVGQAVRLSRTPSQIRTAAHEKGEDSAAILQSLGYDEAAIAALRERHVI